jgi:hypothetical protein
MPNEITNEQNMKNQTFVPHVVVPISVDALTQQPST